MIMKIAGKLVSAFVLASGLAGCGETVFMPEDGDLLFCAVDTSAMSMAIGAATGKESMAVAYDHMAIFGVVDGVPSVIEASSRKGVAITPWDTFLSEASEINGKPAITVMRIKDGLCPEKVIARAMSFLGQPYDWYYLPSNGRMYCSELIYESYLDEAGRHIFQASPMNFRDRDGNMPQFWTDLFSGLGIPVPEGIPGTNPNDMSLSPLLEEVCRLF